MVDQRRVWPWLKFDYPKMLDVSRILNLKLFSYHFQCRSIDGFWWVLKTSIGNKKTISQLKLKFLTHLMGSDPHPLRFGSKGLFRTTWCLRGSWSDARLRWRTKQPECMGAHPAKYIIVYYCVILRSPVSALACLNQRVNFTVRSLFWSPFCCVWHSLPVLKYKLWVFFMLFSEVWGLDLDWFCHRFSMVLTYPQLGTSGWRRAVMIIKDVLNVSIIPIVRFANMFSHRTFA